MFLLAMLMYCPKILYTYSRYIFGSFVSTHLQMNLKRKLKAKLLFKSSCFKRCMVYANNKVLVFPLLYDSLIHVRKKGFSLCHVTVFHSGLTRLFMWLIYDSKKRYVYTGLQSTKIVNVIFSGKIDFFFAFRIQIESLRLRMSLSNSSMSFTSPRFSISYGFMNLLRIDWGDSDSILTSNENKIHTTKKMVYLKGADIS